MHDPGKFILEPRFTHIYKGVTIPSVSEHSQNTRISEIIIKLNTNSEQAVMSGVPGPLRT